MHILGDNGKYLTAELGGGLNGDPARGPARDDALVCDRTDEDLATYGDAWQQFDIVENDDATVALKIGEWYVTAESGGGQAVSTDRTVNEAWQRFTPITLNGRTVYRCVDGEHYLRVGDDDCVDARGRIMDGLGFVPQTPARTYPPEVGAITIARPTMRDAQGACWQWRGFTDFLLLYRYLCGLDLDPFLTERIALGANVLRVFGMVGWDECQPRFYPQDFPDYYAQVRAFADILADRGIRCEYVVFADAQIVMPDEAARQSHLTRVCSALDGTWNVFVEIANEPFKNLPGGEPEAIALAQAVQGDYRLLISSGEFTSWPPAPTADYGTTHPDRTADWPRKCKDLMERCDNSGETPWIGDEPMGCAEVAEPGRRDTNPDNFAWYAAGAQMFGPGATFHCEDGIHSRTPVGPTQAACAKAFYEALDWIPREALLWPYQRGDMGSEAGVGNMPILHDDAIEVRSYCKGNGSQEWCIQIQTSRAHATPRDGWRVVSEPRRGFVYLEKP